MSNITNLKYVQKKAPYKLKMKIGPRYSAIRCWLAWSIWYVKLRIIHHPNAKCCCSNITMARIRIFKFAISSEIIV